MFVSLRKPGLLNLEKIQTDEIYALLYRFGETGAKDDLVKLQNTVASAPRKG